MTRPTSVTDNRPKHAQGSSPKSGEPPIELADTDQLDAQNGAVSESQAGRSATAGSSQAGSSSSVTTGGFDTVFGKLVVERGLVTADEVEMCNELLRESGREGEPRTLSDVLLENKFLTERQLRRLRNEFEANKSSQQIPGYKIKRKLGSGAMATVFLAKQLSLDRLVAIKVLPRKFSDNEKFIERFYKEGRAAAQLNHPNIVGAYDVGKAGEHHYFVMEFVDGQTVYDRIVKDKRLSESEAIEIVRQVALALKHAHERGFIHRDIKPKNIMINREGVVKLADLGLARAVSDKEAAEAEAGRAYGTPYYISPEQIRGERKIGPAADIYGLGATFYHMVTGRVPFEGKNPSEVMHRHLKRDLKPPDHVNPKLTTGCAEVIEMMMAKDQKERYRRVEDLIEDLELVAKGEAPHFAHRELGISAIATELETGPATGEPEQIPVMDSPPSIVNSPAFMVTLVLLIVSVVANLIMLVVLLTGS